MPYRITEQEALARLSQILTAKDLLELYGSFSDKQLLNVRNIQLKKGQLLRAESLAVILGRNLLQIDQLSAQELQLLINLSEEI